VIPKLGLKIWKDVRGETSIPTATDEKIRGRPHPTIE